MTTPRNDAGRDGDTTIRTGPVRQLIRRVIPGAMMARPTVAAPAAIPAAMAVSTLLAVMVPVLVPVVVMVGPSTVYASPTSQTSAASARLTVTARDTTGVLPGATVTVMPSGATAVADAKGIASIDGLAPGTYEVRVSFPGFADTTRAGVTLAAGERQDIDVRLTLPQFSSQVTVSTANRREQLLLDVAENTVLIDQGQIADTGARTAKDLLIELGGAGITVQAGGGQGHLSLNGIPNSGVLVLVDGRRYLGKDANGSFNLEDLLLTGIDRVEVVKGASSALYGSDALGGVVNFITRQQKSRGVTSTLDLSGGSYGDWRVNETAGWRGSRTGVSGSAGYRAYDGFDLDAENPQTIGQPRSRWWTGAVQADAHVTDAMLARLSVDKNNRDIDRYFFSGATQTASTVYDSQRDLTRYAISPGVDYQAPGGTALSVNYTHGKYLRDETRVFPATGVVTPQAPWREWNDELKVSASHNWSAFGSDNPLNGGFEHRAEKLERGTLTTPSPSRDINIFWFQQEVGVGSRLRLTGGARFDDYSDFGQEWSPKASAVFRVNDRQRIRATAGHGFRPPYFGELYLNTPPVFIGNPDLQPETGNTVDVGYSWAGSRVQASADYFYARIKNGITFDLSELPFTYGNLAEYTAKGTNMNASVSLPGGFAPSVSYTYTRRDDDEGEVGGLPHHAAFVKVLWTQSKYGLRANVRGQIYSDVPQSSDGTTQPGYGMWYAQVSKRLQLRGPHAVSAFAQVSNLFDKRDIFLRDENGQPIVGEFQVWMPPRTFLAGVTVDLDWLK
jgi:outer membrane receptor for ferrienterochelin and colicins